MKATVTSFGGLKDGLRTRYGLNDAVAIYEESLTTDTALEH